MINRYTVIGQPIAHSLSPVIHQLFGELTQRKIQYTRTEATVENFHETVLKWQASGGRGCNITLPFKEQALAVCDRLSVGAKRAGSVNTINMHRDGGRVGHNTDGLGLLVDLQQNLKFPLSGKRILLLGAGGAARGVVGPLLDAGPEVLHIVNRTEERATSLAEAFEGDGPVQASAYAQLADEAPYDLVINATSLSLQGEVPPLSEQIFSPVALAYDMMYAKNDTVFMTWSRDCGASVSNGFGMLVEQAAEAFLIWEDARPKTRMAWPRLYELLS